jgi:hypothetical protein
MDLERGAFPADMVHETKIDPDSSKAGFIREPEVRGIKSQTRCAHCHRWVGHVTYHPRVQLAFGYKPVGGMVCRSCHAGLTMYPIMPDFERTTSSARKPHVAMKLLCGVMPASIDD